MGRFLQDEAGAASVEYGSLIAFVALAMVLSLQGLGSALNGTFSTVSGELQDVRALLKGLIAKRLVMAGPEEAREPQRAS